MSDSSPQPAEAQFDGEIAELLQFEPAPRKIKKVDGWTPALQRRFIAKLAELGSPAKAAEALGRCRFGIEKVYKAQGAESFRAAWDRAIEIAEERAAARKQAEHESWAGVRPPGGVDRRLGMGDRQLASPAGPLPGQALNEYGEWEDEESLRRRADDAIDSIRNKLLRCRRLYLQEISGSPGKRAAFEILTELPIDWDKAAAGEAQADEPYTTANQRRPDMVLTAESGWTCGEWGYGPDKKAELRRAIDEHRAEQGLEPVEWSEEGTSE